MTSTKVRVASALVKQQMKEKGITAQVVMALSGYKEIGSTNFNRYMRLGSVPFNIAETLTKFGIKLHD